MLLPKAPRPRWRRPWRRHRFHATFRSLDRGAWPEAATAAGLRLIDPRGDPSAIIEAIASCRVLLAEALHGAIAADALRVPWIALRPLVQVHRAKWHDWAAALDLRVAFHDMAPSSLLERLHASPLAASRSGRNLLDRSSDLLRRMARGRFIEVAARALARAAKAVPQLSKATALDRCHVLEDAGSDPHAPTGSEAPACRVSSLNHSIASTLQTRAKPPTTPSGPAVVAASGGLAIRRPRISGAPARHAVVSRSPELRSAGAHPARRRRLLDVGCGAGSLGAAYRRLNPRARLLGIDMDPVAAKLAARRLDEVAVVDVERDPMPFALDRPSTASSTATCSNISATRGRYSAATSRRSATRARS